MINYLMDLLKESIPILGIIITAMVSITVLKHESWLKAVSSSRNLWLNEFRNEVAIIVGAINMIKHQNLYLKCSSKADRSSSNYKIIYEAEVAKAKLITRLNTNKKIGNEYNKVLKKSNYKFISCLYYNLCFGSY